MVTATKPKRVWDNYIEIGQLRKSNRTKLIIAIGARDGAKYINIREFYFKMANEEWRPSMYGITIPIKLPVDNGKVLIEPIKVFIEVLHAALEKAETMALHDPNNEVWVNQKKEEDA